MPALTMNTKNLLLFLVISLVPLVNGVCRVNGAPKVEQVASDKVKVSWSGLVPNLSCLDFFVVNYWKKGDSKVHDGIPVGPLGAKQFSTEIKVTPRQRYKLQLKTTKRSESGWGESEIVEFKTGRDGGGGNGILGVEGPGGGGGGTPGAVENPTLGAIKYYIIAICGVIVGLIVIGIIYKLVCKHACNKKSSADLEMSLDENNDGSVHKDLLTAE